MTGRLSVSALGPCLIVLFAALLACASAETGDASGKKSPSPGTTVAVVDGKAITRDQLEEKAAPQLQQVRQQEYAALQKALDEMVAEQLLDKEAKTQGVTRDALLKKEITDKVPEPGEPEIDQVWEANKDRVGGKTKAQLLPDIVNFLKNQKSQDAQQKFLQSLRAKYKVQILLEPPRVQVSVDDDPTQGPANAPVTIVEFSDFQCPFCSRVEGTLAQVLANYKDKVRFVYRDFPLPIHPHAPKAAEAAQCADEQGKFWEYHRVLYQDQSKLSLADLEATATRLGLDEQKFKTCLSSGKFAAEVSKDTEDAQKAGVRSTPSFFINGIPLVGAQGYQAFADVIDQELARAGK